MSEDYYFGCARIKIIWNLPETESCWAMRVPAETKNYKNTLRKFKTIAVQHYEGTDLKGPWQKKHYNGNSIL